MISHDTTITVITQIPSPYQVELFDAVAAAGRISLRVIYRSRQHVSRLWHSPTPSHEHLLYEEGTAATQARHWVDGSDLVVFSWYSDRLGRAWLRRRAGSGRPWCLWGERPGHRWGLLGRLRRRLYLAPVRRARVPIWGMGNWAVDGWRQEFGPDRPYENVPYFSNLSRFTRTGLPVRKPTRTVLFSGSLTARKGVDLLADAFADVARDHPQLRLDLLGIGELEPLLQRKLASVREQVRFIGFRQWAELPDFYHTADVLCAPSRYDGWGMIVPEALAAGLPVIATDHTGAAIDLIREGNNGWSVKASSLTGLRSALREVAEMSNDQLDAMSQAATQSVTSHSLEDGVRRFCDAAGIALAGHQDQQATLAAIRG